MAAEVAWALSEPGGEIDDHMPASAAQSHSTSASMVNVDQCLSSVASSISSSSSFSESDGSVRICIGQWNAGASVVDLEEQAADDVTAGVLAFSGFSAGHAAGAAEL